LNCSITDSPPLSSNPTIIKEDASIDQEEICSPCQTDSEYEEYIINRGMLFFFNCEKRGHLEIKCHEGNETKNKLKKKTIMRHN
jgi:hypothetical protein